MAKGDRSFVFECPECKDKLIGSVTPKDVLGIPASNQPGWHIEKWGHDLPFTDWVVQHVCNKDGQSRRARAK